MLKLPSLKQQKKISVSCKTVQQKFKKLKAEGTILGCTIIVDGSKIGFEGKAFADITNKVGFDNSFTLEALTHIPNVFLTTELVD